MTKNNKIIFLTIESIAREYFSRLFLINYLIKKDFIVIIGDKRIINLTSIIKGKKYVLHKDPTFSSRKLAELSKLNGCIFDIIDEEGLLLQSEDIYVNQRLSKETLKSVNTILCWGEYQKKLINAKYPRVSTKVVGNPRIDILQYGSKKLIANRTMNNVILINTKLARYNHKNGSGYFINSIKDNYGVNDESSLEFRRKNQLYIKKLFYSYIDLINKISNEFPNNSIVLRPHPSESIQTWKKILNNTNVVVTQKGSIVEWLKISKCVIHTGCSTALESRISSIPAISYEPYQKDGDIFDDKLGNKVSFRCYSIREVISAVNDVFKSRLILNDYKEITSDYLYLGEKKSSELIAEHVDQTINKYNFKKYRSNSLGIFVLVKLSVLSYLRIISQYFKKISSKPFGNIVWFNKQKVKKDFLRVNGINSEDIIVKRVIPGVVSIVRK